MSQKTAMQIIKENKPGLSPQTYKTYVYSIKRLRQVAGDLDPVVIADYLDTQQPNVAKQLLSALIAYDGPVRWSPMMSKYDEGAKAIRIRQSLSDRESDNWVQWKTFKLAVSRMRKDVKMYKFFTKGSLTMQEFKLLAGYVACAVHLDIPMRNDLPSIRIAATTGDAVDRKVNYFVLSTGNFVMHEFKTKASFKRRRDYPLIITPQKATRRLLMDFVDLHKSKVLLPRNRQGAPYSREGYNGLLQKITYRYLGVRIGSSMLRKI